MSAELNHRLLDILCCPITRRPLRHIDELMLERVNSAIVAGKVRTNGGAELTEPLEAALISTDGDLVYPIRDGIPILFEEECIHWAAYKDT